MTESTILGQMDYDDEVYRAGLDLLANEANEKLKEVGSKKRVRVVSVDRLLEIGEWE